MTTDVQDEPVALLDAALRALATTEAPLVGRRDRVRALASLRDRLDALFLREVGLLQHTDELALDGSDTVVGWLRAHTGASLHDARRDAALARRLRSLPRLAEAAESGEVTMTATRSVVAAVQQLPAELVPDVEPALVEAARQLSPEELRVLLAEKVAALAPTPPDARSERSRVRLGRVGDRYALDGDLHPLLGERLAVTLDALIEADRRTDDDRTMTERRADALATVLDLAAEADGMPRTHEAVPHLIVTASAAAMVGEPGAAPARTLGGELLSAGQLARISCDAVVSRVLHDNAGHPVDSSPARRSTPPRLWRALLVRDRHCQVTGCTRPASRCAPHHLVPWHLGGPTTLGNLVLLCHPHHHALHGRERPLELRDGRTLTPTGPSTAYGPAPPLVPAA